MQNYFEATKEQKQLATIGRDMMDFSENYGKEFGLGQLKEEGLRVLNELSQVGNMLTRYGATFGTTQKDFTEADMQLISKFMKKELDFPSK
jgi:hypothetical protein|tara:strand:+ start:273 stop:545 length:273 start_codon:yes stop_codon:yes gene_type:complete